MKRAYLTVVSAVLMAMLVAAMAAGQAGYQAKFKGDPARSDSEAAALGYMRTFLRAQKIYKKKYGHYATTLLDLTKTGSFTRRMAGTDRGDYTAKFKSHKEKDTFDSRSPWFRSSLTLPIVHFSQMSKEKSAPTSRRKRMRGRRF